MFVVVVVVVVDVGIVVGLVKMLGVVVGCGCCLLASALLVDTVRMRNCGTLPCRGRGVPEVVVVVAFAIGSETAAVLGTSDGAVLSIGRGVNRTSCR